jgi:hypothetical protein
LKLLPPSNQQSQKEKKLRLDKTSQEDNIVKETTEVLGPTMAQGFKGNKDKEEDINLGKVRKESQDLITDQRKTEDQKLCKIKTMIQTLL